MGEGERWRRKRQCLFHLCRWSASFCSSCEISCRRFSSASRSRACCWYHCSSSCWRRSVMRWASSDSCLKASNATKSISQSCWWHNVMHWASGDSCLKASNVSQSVSPSCSWCSVMHWVSSDSCLKASNVSQSIMCWVPSDSCLRANNKLIHSSISQSIHQSTKQACNHP